MKVTITETVTPEGKQFENMLKDLSKLEVRVGFQAGQAAEDNGADVCAVAAWNELGTEHMPSRPFMRQSVDNHESEIDAFIQSLKSYMFSGNATAEEILRRIGVFQKGLIQEEIRNGSFAPNAPSTIKKKGSSHPLIDTGTMRQSVNFVITEKGSGE